MFLTYNKKGIFLFYISFINNLKKKYYCNYRRKMMAWNEIKIRFFKIIK